MGMIQILILIGVFIIAFMIAKKTIKNPKIMILAIILFCIALYFNIPQNITRFIQNLL